MAAPNAEFVAETGRHRLAGRVPGWVRGSYSRYLAAIAQPTSLCRVGGRGGGCRLRLVHSRRDRRDSLGPRLASRSTAPHGQADLPATGADPHLLYVWLRYLFDPAELGIERLDSITPAGDCHIRRRANLRLNRVPLRPIVSD